MISVPEKSLNTTPTRDTARHLLTERLQSRVAATPPRQEGAPFIQSLYRTTLLSPEEERCLFEHLAELKAHEAELSVMSLDLQCSDSTQQLRAVRSQIVELRNHLVESNLRLVVSIAKSFQSSRDTDFYELVSEGNSILLKAVDLFNASYGYRFSTYATTALRRGLMNLCNANHRRKQRFVSGQEEPFDSLQDEGEVLLFDETHDIKKLLTHLDARERSIIEDRFGLKANNRGMTYRAIGEKLQLSKERVRQIIVRALSKMRAHLPDSDELANQQILTNG